MLETEPRILPMLGKYSRLEPREGHISSLRVFLWIYSIFIRKIPARVLKAPCLVLFQTLWCLPREDPPFERTENRHQGRGFWHHHNPSSVASRRQGLEKLLPGRGEHTGSGWAEGEAGEEVKKAPQMSS